MKSSNLNVPLLLPEYGRNVQKMVEFLLTIEDRKKRCEQAKIVITTMANVYPHSKRDTVEFRTMLYDHLFMISGFQLDIDWEFETPDPNQFAPVPSKMPYTQQGIVRKQYGALVPRIARQIAGVEDPETRKAMSESLAKFMRQKSYDYNLEYPSDELIVADLFDMSNGEVNLNVAVFEGSQINAHRNARQNNGGNNNNKQRSKNHRQKNNKGAGGGGGGGNNNNHNHNQKKK